MGVAAGLIAVFMASGAHAQDAEVDMRGRFQSDLRFRVFHLDDPEGPWFNPNPPPPGVIRNQNMVNVNMLAKSGDFRGRADVDVVMTGYPGNIGYPGEFNQLGDLASRSVLEPVRFETHSMYLEGRDVFIKGLDIRVGQQLVQFGVGDQFNPTNVFNPNDVEDVLMFGEQMGNIMARADYWLGGNWTATAVLIPVHKPSLIPQTGPLALTKIPRLPFYEDELRWRVHSEARLGRLQGYPTVIGDVNIQMPEASVQNMPFGFNLGGSIGMHDVAVMYYNGYADVPTATQTHTSQQVFDEPLCQGQYGIKCINGLLVNEVTLEYPAIQVVGYNMAGEVNPLFFVPNVAPLGYRIEAAVVVPEQVRTKLTQDELVFGPLVNPAGEYLYGVDTPDGPNGGRPVVIDDTPYAKWVMGLDYTVGKHLMINGQWVHGMLDEIGAGDNIVQSDPVGYVTRDGGVAQVRDDEGNLVDQSCGIPRLLDPEGDPGPGETCAEETRRRRLSDLAVIGFDINFSNRAGLIRIFTITDLTGIRMESYNEAQEKRVAKNYGAFTPEGRSGILLLEGNWNFGNGFDLGGGMLHQYGAPYTKFGDAANGGSFLFTRARYAF